MPGKLTRPVCPVCHKERENSDRFCVYCGAILPDSGARASPSQMPRATATPEEQPTIPPSERANLLVFALMFLAFPALIWTAYYLLQRNAKPAPRPTTARAQPVLPPGLPAGAPVARFRDLTPAEVADATRELKPLLGDLWYPGASLQGKYAAFVGRTARQGDPRYRLAYPAVILLPPPDQDYKTVCAYYERVAPGGTYQKNGNYMADQIPRPGDGVPVRVIVSRPPRGPNAGRVIVMTLTLR